MEDPYQPPKAAGDVEQVLSAIWKKRLGGMVILLSTTTLLMGITLAWLAGRYAVALRSFQDRAPAFLQEALQFAWRDPSLPFLCGTFLGAIAFAFLQFEKRIAALASSLFGAGMIIAWAIILKLAIAG